MTSLALSRCKKTSHVILRFEENYQNAGGPLELLASIITNYIQGSHEHWKTWKITKKSSMHGKIMEFEKKLKNPGKIMEFCEIICVFDCLFSG